MQIDEIAQELGDNIPFHRGEEFERRFQTIKSYLRTNTSDSLTYIASLTYAILNIQNRRYRRGQELCKKLKREAEREFDSLEFNFRMHVYNWARDYIRGYQFFLVEDFKILHEPRRTCYELSKCLSQLILVSGSLAAILGFFIYKLNS